jgi:para-nitrobenzyl esterase
MQRRTFLGLSALTVATPLKVSAQSEVSVSTAQGRLIGSRQNGVCVFKGIRYGEDTRSRRFRPALPVHRR